MPKKIRYGNPDPFERYENAITPKSEPAPVTPVPTPVTPTPKPSTFKPGKLYPLTSITDEETLRKRALRGSKPFSDSELKRGYRKMGSGK